jgi:hypothetical protein
MNCPRAPTSGLVVCPGGCARAGKSRCCQFRVHNSGNSGPFLRITPHAASIGVGLAPRRADLALAQVARGLSNRRLGYANS